MLDSRRFVDISPHTIKDVPAPFFAPVEKTNGEKG